MSPAPLWMSPAGADYGYVWTRQGRSRVAAFVMAVVWAILLAALVLIDAAWWIVGMGFLCTLPTLYDFATNPSAGVKLNARELCWHSGRRQACIEIQDLDHIRLDRRFDLSVRTTAVLRSGQRLRLPFESTPPHEEFETACHARGLRVQRHPFSPFV